MCLCEEENLNFLSMTNRANVIVLRIKHSVHLCLIPRTKGDCSYALIQEIFLLRQGFEANMLYFMACNTLWI